MRRLLAAFTVVVLTTLACSDPLFCPDGCTDEPAQQAGTAAPQPAHGDCLACRSALSTALPLFELIPGDRTDPGDRALPPRIPDSTPRSIDHPPRG
jgi:hypothetical protein